MQNTISAGIAAVGAASISFLMTSAGIDTVDRVSSPPSPRVLQISNLSFVDGVFTQTSKVIGEKQMNADWAASITRGGFVLCSGGGVAPYKSQTITMDPNGWTGGNCPILRDGDTASATWEWRDEQGFYHSIGREITISME